MTGTYATTFSAVSGNAGTSVRKRFDNCDCLERKTLLPGAGQSCHTLFDTLPTEVYFSLFHGQCICWSEMRRTDHWNPYGAGPTSIRKHCPRHLHAGACQTLKVVLARRLHCDCVERMQRNFEPMRKQVETWQRSELAVITAKWSSTRRSSRANSKPPKHLARRVHDLFEPSYEEFRPRTIWNLPNAFTSAIQRAGSGPAIQGDSQVGEFLESVLTIVPASRAVS